MSLPALATRTEPFLQSGFKRIFAQSRELKNPINLGVGQPHFDVPESLKEAAIAAIRAGHNGYTLPHGLPELRQLIKETLDQRNGRRHEVMIACGTNGALTLALQAILNPGDEAIVFDPYFVVYPQLVGMVGGRTVLNDTYPDFQPDPQRVSNAITAKTKAIILCSPGNPTGVVTQPERVRALARLADERGILLISDEIYATFVYDEPFHSPAAMADNVLVCSSFSKTHAMTGWRLGYAYGPDPIIQAMIGLQQATFVCAPSIAQKAGIQAWKYPMEDYVRDYQRKRDWLLANLDSRYQAVRPGGGFYLFPQVPWGTGADFVQAALRDQLVLMPGSVFSRRDTHFRISYGVEDEVLARGVEVLNRLADSTSTSS